MGKVKEALYEELERTARNTGENETEIKQQWEKAKEEGIEVEEFIIRKARKKHLPK